MKKRVKKVSQESVSLTKRVEALELVIKVLTVVVSFTLVLSLFN